MRYLLLVVWISSLIILALPVSPTTAQNAPAIDVFLAYYPDRQEVEVYFSNPITGLSALATIENFPPDLNPLDEFNVIANGVVYRDPTTGLPHLITPTGRILNFSFIPQSPIQLDRIDWVLSDDMRTIAWAEIDLNQLGWQSRIYVADVDGNNLRTLPELPILPVQITRRVEMLGVSNGGDRIFFDNEHLPEKVEGFLFVGYQRVTAYAERISTYFDLPNEPNCLCPALITDNGQALLRLQSSFQVNGYELHVWNLEDNTEVVVPAIEMPYDQAGFMLLNPSRALALYLIGEINAEGETYGLVLVNIASRQQTVILDEWTTRLRPMAFIDRNTSALLVDIDEQVTYKLRLDTGEMSAVADKMWIGTIQG